MSNVVAIYWNDHHISVILEQEVELYFCTSLRQQSILKYPRPFTHVICICRYFISMKCLFRCCICEMLSYVDFLNFVRLVVSCLVFFVCFQFQEYRANIIWICNIFEDTVSCFILNIRTVILLGLRCIKENTFYGFRPIWYAYYDIKIHCGRDPMVVRFTTTYAIIVYPH